MKKVLMLAMFFASAAQAEEFYQPRSEVQAFFVSGKLDPALKVSDFSGDPADVNDLPSLKGIGGTLRLNVRLTEGARLLAEGSYAKPSKRYTAQDVKYEVESIQGRGGVRFVAAAKNGAPVYAEAGADAAYYRFDDKAVFGRSYANPGSTSYRGVKDGIYGVGHVAAGYRTAPVHAYADLGYGMGDEDNLFEITVGTAYTFASGLQVLGEYRATTLEGSDGDIKLNELRLGLGLSF